MAGPSPEVCYSLDCAVEAGDITSDIHAYICAIHPDPDGWYAMLDPHPDFFASLRAGSRAALAEWRAAAPLQDRATVTWAGLEGLPRALVDSARATLTEATKAGARPGGFDRGEIARLMSDRDFVAIHARPFLPALSEIAMRAGEDVRIMGPDAFRATRDRLDDLYMTAERRRMEIAYAARGKGTVPVPKEPKRERKARRKPLRRSAEFLSCVVGDRKARAFISGDDVVVQGKRFDFRVRKGVLSSNGHGGMNLTVTDKDSVELSDLCFYFRDMPAADQLAGLVLHVQAGEEEAILRTANVIRAYPAASANVDLSRVRAEREAEKRAGLGLSENADDPFGMGRHLDLAVFEGALGASSVYNELHDLLVPEAMEAALEVAWSGADGRLLLSVSESLGTRLRDECRTFEMRVAPRHETTEELVDRAVEALPRLANAEAWRSLVDRFVPEEAEAPLSASGYEPEPLYAGDTAYAR